MRSTGSFSRQRPASIRVIGQAPVIGKNIFDMVSDGKTFSIYVPSKNEFLVGAANLERHAEKPIENLRPQHLIDALFWPPIPERVPVLLEEASEENARYYVLTVVAQATSLPRRTARTRVQSIGRLREKSGSIARTCASRASRISVQRR